MRVRRTCALAMLFLPLIASAAPERKVIDRAGRRMAVIERGRAFTHDRLGNSWVYHTVREVPREEKAAAVSLVRGNGTVRTYFASDLLPPGEVYPGMAGQVFTISPMTTPGHYVAAVGYISREHLTRNAVVVFAVGQDGEPRTVRFIQIRNAATAIGGPRDTIVVTAVDALDSASFALATVLDIDGNVQAELLPFGAPGIIEAAAVARSVRLQQSGASGFAVYDPESQTVQHYSAGRVGALPSLANAAADLTMRQPRAANQEIVFEADWAISIKDPGIGAARLDVRPVLELHVDDARQTVTAARNVIADGVPRAVVSRYDGRGIETWVSDMPWNSVLWQGDAVIGFGPRRGTVQQRVSLNGRIALQSDERAPRAAAAERSGCTSWMTARQCAQISAGELPLGEIKRLRSIIRVNDNGGGVGCMDDGYNMCAHSVSTCFDYWKDCNLDFEGNTYPMNCTMDECMYDACYPYDCWRNTTKMCCPDEPPVGTTNVTECNY
jgi:hypothetical protein